MEINKMMRCVALAASVTAVGMHGGTVWYGLSILNHSRSFSSDFPIGQFAAAFCFLTTGVTLAGVGIASTTPKPSGITSERSIISVSVAASLSPVLSGVFWHLGWLFLPMGCVVAPIVWSAGMFLLFATAFRWMEAGVFG
jgi:hypothetical protein